MTVSSPMPSGRGIALLALSGLNAVALLGVSLWLITRASAQPPIMYLQMAIVGVRAFALGRAFFRYVGRLVSHDSAFRALARIRSTVFDRLITVGPLRLTSRQHGSIVSTFVRDVDSLQDDALRFREPLWVNAIVVIVTLATIAVFSPVAGLILAVGCAAAVVAIVVIDRFTAQRSAREVAPVRAELYSAVTERIRHDAVLRAFEAETRAEGAIAAIDARLARLLVAPAGVTAVSTAVSTVAMGLVAVTVIAVHPVTDPQALVNTAPQFTFVALISLALGEFLLAIPGILEARRTVAAAQARIADIVDGGTVDGEESVVSGLATVDSIVLTEVSARYTSGESVALAPVSFAARRGDVVVVTGPSGSGKSTLANVLVGFLPITTGSFTVDGIESRDMVPASLRARIGLCEQRPHIFAETLRHNLDFANDSATDEQLWAVLKRVGLANWASDRDGLDTHLGESGTLVSGGQAQRIALARVLLADRAVIVLDEPTANLQQTLAEDLLRDVLAATADTILIVLSHTPVPRVRNTIEVALC